MSAWQGVPTDRHRPIIAGGVRIVARAYREAPGWCWEVLVGGLVVRFGGPLATMRDAEAAADAWLVAMCADLAAGLGAAS